jgi:hypothetical protein
MEAAPPVEHEPEGSAGPETDEEGEVVRGASPTVVARDDEPPAGLHGRRPATSVPNGVGNHAANPKRRVERQRRCESCRDEGGALRIVDGAHRDDPTVSGAGQRVRLTWELRRGARWRAGARQAIHVAVGRLADAPAVEERTVGRLHEITHVRAGGDDARGAEGPVDDAGRGQADNPASGAGLEVRSPDHDAAVRLHDGRGDAVEALRGGEVHPSPDAERRIRRAVGVETPYGRPRRLGER